MSNKYTLCNFFCLASFKQSGKIGVANIPFSHPLIINDFIKLCLGIVCIPINHLPREIQLLIFLELDRPLVGR